MQGQRRAAVGLRVRISVGVGAQGWGRGCGYGQVMVHCGDSVGGSYGWAQVWFEAGKGG